jgi:hypothetical protein
VRDSNKIDELNAYLAKYPNGTFATLAQARIQTLQNGPSTTTRNLTTGIDPSTFTEEADQASEDVLSLDKGTRRDVQRRLTGLGFEIRANGRFDDETRNVIRRWQSARGYPATGYLNKLQYQALQSEIVSTRVASSDDDGEGERSGGSRHYRSSGRHYYRGGGGGPGGFFGGMMRGMFR